MTTLHHAHIWSPDRKKLTNKQWETLFLMCKDGEVSTEASTGQSGLRVCSEVQQSFTLWYPKGSSPTGFKEIEIHRETPVSEFWLDNLRGLFDVWKSSKTYGI